jgi:hypothetical protein
MGSWQIWKLTRPTDLTDSFSAWTTRVLTTDNTRGSVRRVSLGNGVVAGFAGYEDVLDVTDYGAVDGGRKKERSRR